MDGFTTKVFGTTRVTYLNGTRHSFNDMPAVCTINGLYEWYYLGHLHRIGRPAVIYPNGDVEYYVHGVRQNSAQSTRCTQPTRCTQSTRCTEPRYYASTREPRPEKRNWRFNERSPRKLLQSIASKDRTITELMRVAERLRTENSEFRQQLQD